MKEPFGYSCLTNVRQFYSENYPTIVIEQNHIDTMIPILLKRRALMKGLLKKDLLLLKSQIKYIVTIRT